MKKLVNKSNYIQRDMVKQADLNAILSNLKSNPDLLYGAGGAVGLGGLSYLLAKLLKRKRAWAYGLGGAMAGGAAGLYGGSRGVDFIKKWLNERRAIRKGLDPQTNEPVDMYTRTPAHDAEPPLDVQINDPVVEPKKDTGSSTAADMLQDDIMAGKAKRMQQFAGKSNGSAADMSQDDIMADKAERMRQFAGKSNEGTAAAEMNSASKANGVQEYLDNMNSSTPASRDQMIPDEDTSTQSSAIPNYWDGYQKLRDFYGFNNSFGTIPFDMASALRRQGQAEYQREAERRRGMYSGAQRLVDAFKR